MISRSDDPSRAEIVAAFRKQAGFCRKRGADFTAAVVSAAGDEIEAGGVLADLVADFEGEPVMNALALRVAGALHALVLSGGAGDLAAFYDTPHIPPDTEGLRNAMALLWSRETSIFKKYIAKAPQTNEVRRAAALLPGFSEIAETANAPLDLLELGASSGLLLGWDRFRYDYGVAQWGESDAVIEAEWHGDEPPQLCFPIPVRRRAGCDLNPFDLSDPTQRLHARSYIWPENAVRLAVFDKAVEKNAGLSAHVEKADALQWLEAQLAGRAEDGASVVFHSVFALYLSAAQRARLEEMLEAAGRTATAAAPLAWLRFEPHEAGDDMEFYTDLRVWPGGEDRRLARAQPHGAWVEPLGDF